MIGQNQPQRAGYQRGKAVGVGVQGRAQAQLVVGQQFPPVGVDDDVLRGAEEGHQRDQYHDTAQRLLRAEVSGQADAGKQGQLGQQQPAAPPAHGQGDVTVQQRRPEKLPGIGYAHQRKQADGGQVHLFAAQPGRHHLKQQIQWQAGAEAVQHAQQHAPVEPFLLPAAHLSPPYPAAGPG